MSTEREQRLIDAVLMLASDVESGDWNGVLGRITRTINGAATPEAAGRGWIDVKQELPPENEVVLCQGFNFNDPARGFWKLPLIAIFTRGKFYDQIKDDSDEELRWSDDSVWASNWQPLPAPPSGEPGCTERPPHDGGRVEPSRTDAF